MSVTDALFSRSSYAYLCPGCSVSHCARRWFRRSISGSLFLNPSAITFRSCDAPRSAPVRSVRSKRDPEQTADSRNQPAPDCLPTGQPLRALTGTEKPQLPLDSAGIASGSFPACQPCQRKSVCIHQDQHSRRMARSSESCGHRRLHRVPLAVNDRGDIPCGPGQRCGPTHRRSLDC